MLGIATIARKPLQCTAVTLRGSLQQCFAMMSCTALPRVAVPWRIISGSPAASAYLRRDCTASPGHAGARQCLAHREKGPL